MRLGVALSAWKACAGRAMRVKGARLRRVSLRDGEAALDAHRPVRPSFHHALQGDISPALETLGARVGWVVPFRSALVGFAEAASSSASSAVRIGMRRYDAFGPSSHTASVAKRLSHQRLRTPRRR